jgi:hypothetical protein
VEVPVWNKPIIILLGGKGGKVRPVRIRVSGSSRTYSTGKLTIVIAEVEIAKEAQAFDENLYRLWLTDKRRAASPRTTMANMVESATPIQIFRPVKYLNDR